ncbi:hypothetical protein [[Mycoplasma] testudinis]|uniref:hypothetical protein n=1 Tax=[Mycoplasma] testudinis TaxID=33924 RepID=UPI00047F4640|nr:hypothetical protein [[Mycoplasma] testudinis]
MKDKKVKKIRYKKVYPIKEHYNPYTHNWTWEYDYSKEPKLVPKGPLTVSSFFNALGDFFKNLFKAILYLIWPID